MATRKSEFLAGLRAEIPILIGVLPFGMIYGVFALAAGMSPQTSQSMSWIVFAGSSQMVFAQLYGVGAPAWVIILTVGVVNIRHALYSASIAPFLKPLSLAWKLALAYLLTDEAYAVSITYYQKGSDQNQKEIGRTSSKHWYLLGAGFALWITWQISTTMGIFLGQIIPEKWSLDFALTLTFIALVVPNLKDISGVITALAAGIIALLTLQFPYKLGLILAAFSGVTAGLLVRLAAARRSSRLLKSDWRDL